MNRCLRTELEWAGVTLPVTVAGAPLEARYLESGADALLVLFNPARSRRSPTARSGARAAAARQRTSSTLGA